MTDLYKIDPEAMKARTRQASEEHLVTLQDDSTKPPPTIGTAPWQGIIFGPAFGQPVGEITKSTRVTWKIILGILGLIMAISIVQALVRGF